MTLITLAGNIQAKCVFVEAEYSDVLTNCSFMQSKVNVVATCLTKREKEREGSGHKSFGNLIFVSVGLQYKSTLPVAIHYATLNSFRSIKLPSSLYKPRPS